MRQAWLMGLWCVAVGCTTPVSFGRDAAQAQCKTAETCDRSAFEALYDSTDECVDSVQGFYGGDCYLDNCETFVLDEALDCLDALSAEECSDSELFPAACGRVWTDCADLALGICLLAEGFGFEEDE